MDTCLVLTVGCRVATRCDRAWSSTLFLVDLCCDRLAISESGLLIYINNCIPEASLC